MKTFLVEYIVLAIMIILQARKPRSQHYVVSDLP